MTEWATADEFKSWSDMPKVQESDEGTLLRMLKRARLNILSILRQSPSAVDEQIKEALFIVAERILLGRDQAVLATSAKGLASAQFGDHSIAFGTGNTQNPFVTQEVMALLEPYMSKFPSAPLEFDKVIVAGDAGYDSDEEVDFTLTDYTRTRGPYPYVP
jgi:hypothetical protein